jgi:hypothetical protein
LASARIEEGEDRTVGGGDVEGLAWGGGDFDADDGAVVGAGGTDGFDIEGEAAGLADAGDEGIEL